MKKKNNAVSPKKSLNIVILGNKGSGKTTLLASLIHNINSREDLVLSYNMKNKAGIFLLNQIWQETLVKGQFPPRENSLKSETVDISFKPSYENINYRLKFSELSISFPPKKEIDSNEDDDPDDYIDSALAADMVILILTSLNTEDSGKIFHWIFEYLKKLSAAGEEEGALRQELKENLSRLSREPENIDILRETRGIYLKLGDESEAEEVEKKLNRLIEKKEYKSNLGKRIYLRQMEVQGLNFFGKFRWIFQPGMNVLLGRNGYGKSHLLRFLATLLQKDELKSQEFFEHSKADPFARLTVEREESQEIISRNQLVFEESIGRVPLLAIPDMRSLDQSRTVVSYSGDGKEMDLSQQWCYHFLYQKPVEGLIQDFLYQLCITYLDRGKTGKIGAIVNSRPSITGAAAII